MKKKILILLLVLAAGAAIYAYYLWNKPPETAADKKPISVLSADSLMSEFKTDETAAWNKYKGDQVIQVSGKITDVKIDSVTTLLLETQDIMGVISCTFAIDQPITKKIGDNIELKGICAGFNMDVELRQCVLVQ
jgi:co-chaperonin GroES (HSP10)